MLWVSILLALYGLLFASEYLASSTSIHSFDSQRVFVWEAGSLAPDLVTLRLKVTKTRPYTVEPSQFHLLSTKHARYWLFRYMTAHACSTKPVFTFAKGIHLTRPYLNKIQSVSAIAYPFDFRDFITITDASLYAIRSIFFDRHMKGKEILPAWRSDK